MNWENVAVLPVPFGGGCKFGTSDCDTVIFDAAGKVAFRWSQRDVSWQRPVPEPEPMCYVEFTRASGSNQPFFPGRVGPMPRSYAEKHRVDLVGVPSIYRNVRITPITPRVWWRHSECSNSSYFYDGERFACQQYGPFIRPARPDEVPTVGYVLSTDPDGIVREA